jgi:hypothetical protein
MDSLFILVLIPYYAMDSLFILVLIPYYAMDSLFIFFFMPRQTSLLFDLCLGDTMVSFIVKDLGSFLGNVLTEKGTELSGCHMVGCIVMLVEGRIHCDVYLVY